jgi:hypothetical protein
MSENILAMYIVFELLATLFLVVFFIFELFLHTLTNKKEQA